MLLGFSSLGVIGGNSEGESGDGFAANDKLGTRDGLTYFFASFLTGTSSLFDEVPSWTLLKSTLA